MKKTNILIAGHDLKFLTHVMNYFQANSDFHVEIHTYSGHILTDTDRIKKELAGFDIIFCEWGLGNLQWYSQNKLPWQKLITRIHSQEFFTKFLAETNWINVDKIIFVGPYMLEKFIGIFPDIREKCLVIPNLIEPVSFDLEKEKKFAFHLGLLGILPKLKAPHLALDILKELRKTDKRYKLYIKSKRPEELDWLWQKPEEQEYYKEFFNSLDELGLQEAVVFEPHGSDVQQWFRHIGFIVSTSDYEAFHMAVAEGMASGSVPVIRNWEGAKDLFPERLIFNDVKEAVSLILSYSDPEKYKAESKELKNFCRENFSPDSLLPEYRKILFVDKESRKLRKEYCQLEVLKNKLITEFIAGLKSEISEDFKNEIKGHEDLIFNFSKLMNEVHELKSELALNQETNRNLQSEIKQMKNELATYQVTNSKLKDNLNVLSQEAKENKRKLNEIHNSLSWKVGSALIRKPIKLFTDFSNKSK